MRGRIRSRIDYFRFVWGSEWFYAIGILGAAIGLITAGLPKWVLTTLWAAGLAITVLAAARDTRDLGRRWFKGRLVANPRELNTFSFKGVQWSPDRQDNDFVHLNAAIVGGDIDDPTGKPERIWRSAELNQTLWEHAGNAPVALKHRRFRLPESLREVAPQALRQTALFDKKGAARRVKPAVWFNGQLCRLATDPTVELLKGVQESNGPHRNLELQRVTYFDGQASNELWHWSLDAPISPRQGGIGGYRIPLNYVVDLDRQVLQLDYARVANIVGITILAITSDDKIIMVKQSENNSVLPGGFTASASGSLDWADLKQAPHEPDGTLSLGNVLLQGMLRELEEESCVRRGRTSTLFLPRRVSEIVPGSARITGYFRWLSRAAKPEFTGIVKLTVSSEALSTRKVRGDEKLYTDTHAAVPLNLLRTTSSDWSDSLDALHSDLRKTTDKPFALGASGVAAWFAAADYLRAHPDY